MTTPYLQDADFTLYQGDALEVLRTLPDESVHMCVTSPPFYGLRDYGTGTWQGGDAECDHVEQYRDPTKPAGSGGVTNKRPDLEERQTASLGGRKQFRATCGKCGATRIDRQIGLEETPEQWVQKLVEVFREVRRVLRRDGTCWVEVGDSYGAPNSGSTAQRVDGGTPHRTDGLTIRHPYKPKDLIGAPWLLAFALRADGWYLRSDIVWSRPNPMPESVTDRPTKSHSYVFLLSRSARYFFDQEAVREAHEYNGGRGATNRHAEHTLSANATKPQTGLVEYDGSGRNIRSVWEIATQPYPEAHFATYPEELVRRCILAGTSERGCCPECGAPWVREVTSISALAADGKTCKRCGKNHGKPREGSEHRAAQGVERFVCNDYETTGWHPGCACGDEQFVDYPPVPCTVLDPFSGSGTTALVARKHGRKCIGIELSVDYCELSARRLQQLSLLSEVGS